MAMLLETQPRKHPLNNKNPRPPLRQVDGKNDSLRSELNEFAKGAMRRELVRFKEELLRGLGRCESFRSGSDLQRALDRTPSPSEGALENVSPRSIWEPLLWKADVEWKPTQPSSARDIVLKPQAPVPYAQLDTEEPNLLKDQYQYFYRDRPKHECGSDLSLEELNELSDTLTERERVLKEIIANLSLMSSNRMKPYNDEMEEVKEAKEKCLQKIEIFNDALLSEGPPPVGPRWLRWVDSYWFSIICNVVVALNLAEMLAQGHVHNMGISFKVFDQLFLIWYAGELGLKTWYRQRALFIGRLSTVWWNWLDLAIVVCGVLDQWLVPLVQRISGNGGGGLGIPIDTNHLRGLRFLRLFRVVRVLKLVKGLMHADLSWVEGGKFEAFLTGVITANAFVMSLELDYDECCGVFWKALENVFLIIYFLEISIKFKRWGCNFFCHPEQWAWNCLDFVIVVGAVTDLWLLPLIDIIYCSFTGKSGTLDLGTYGNFLSLLRMMRLLRILRLVRLVREIKPLYRLIVGVTEALRAMMWVLVLTLIILYAGAILFTSGVGKGYLYGGNPPPGSDKGFSTVARSLFSLFKLMNGDIDVVVPICNTLTGKLLFIMFMVLSNWAVLAILTSVVSDNMIAASARTIQEDEDAAREAANEATMRRLFTLFGEIDSDRSGEISEVEWKKTLDDEGLQHELLDASGLGLEDLLDLYECFAVEVTTHEDEGGSGTTRRVLKYRDFVENMKYESQVADKRSVLHIMNRLRTMEGRLDTRLRNIESKTPTIAERLESRRNSIRRDSLISKEAAGVQGVANGERYLSNQSAPPKLR